MSAVQLGSIVGIAGLLIIAAALIQGFLNIQFALARSMQAGRVDRARLALFEDRAATVLQRAKADRDAHELSWNGLRKFQVERRVFENPNKDICSFYLVAHDKRPIPPFKAGQYLTFQLPIPGEPQAVYRCYSLSDSPAERDYYRVSIKRLDAPPKAPKGTPPGLSSTFFHNMLEEGDIVEVQAPNGEFYIDDESERPVVLIAGGVGLTPLISMMNWLIATESRREIWFFYGVRNRGEHAMYEMLKRVEKENSNIHVVVVYADPTETCREGVDYDVKGFVSVDLLKSKLGSTNYEFYICGPPPMMTAITTGLDEWGVPEADVRFEAFGPASVQKSDDEKEEVADTGETFKVEFSRSKTTVDWAPKDGTILELAEAHNIKARCGCRAGSCGSCLTALMQGDVDYLHRPGAKPEAGSCLICISKPKSDLVIDL